MNFNVSTFIGAAMIVIGFWVVMKGAQKAF